MWCQLAHALYSHSFRLFGEAVASQSVCRFYLVIGGGEGEFLYSRACPTKLLNAVKTKIWSAYMLRSSVQSGRRTFMISEPQGRFISLGFACVCVQVGLNYWDSHFEWQRVKPDMGLFSWIALFFWAMACLQSVIEGSIKNIESYLLKLIHELTMIKNSLQEIRYKANMLEHHTKVTEGTRSATSSLLHETYEQSKQLSTIIQILHYNNTR